jgi:Arc/MetJ-type ribon-helix-helix transcriptional regulator
VFANTIIREKEVQVGRRGSRDEALREAQAALAAAKDDRDREQAREMLEFLQKAASSRP